MVDPALGLGVIYINDFRALSFRYYSVRGTTLSAFAEPGFVSLDGVVRVRSADQNLEDNNG